MRISLFFAFIVSIVSAPGQALNYPAEVVVRVLEETGGVVSNAHVLVSFEQNSRGGNNVVCEGLTNSNGVFAITESTSGYIYIRIEKEKYYDSARRLKWHQQQSLSGAFPSSGVTNDIVLRRKVNPIPMFAKRVYTQIPKSGQEFGYDLEAGDWVAPLGRGTVHDVYFKVEGYWKDHRHNDATLTVRFFNPKDGLVLFEDLSKESLFRSPYAAPVYGYTQEKRWRKSRVPNPEATDASHMEIVTMDRNDNANYFFRIRTKLKDDGEIASALYGKIYGEIEFGGASQQGGYLKFGGYYLNPNLNDRNLEFDPELNLFKNLSSDEEVHEP